MDAALRELPLALFTTLAPLGAGAFVALALLQLTTNVSGQRLKKIDRMSLLPAAVVIVGFITSFFHLASPLHAPFVLTGIGRSPLSNEILVGSCFVIIMIIYLVLALCGKLTPAAHKVAAVIVGIAAIVFALFTGLAYVMDTIASWYMPLVPLELLGCALLGGVVLASLVLFLAGELPRSTPKPFVVAWSVLTAVGFVLALGCFVAQMASITTLSTPLDSGSELVGGMFAWIVVAVLCLLVATGALLVLIWREKRVVLLSIAVVAVVVGIFVARLVFYAVQLSVGLSFS